MSTYVIIKCPRCLSTSLVKITSSANEDFICPVCSEGQIKSPAEPDNLSVVGITVTVRQQADGRMMVRANAIFNNRPIEDPKVYQNFFATLERSLFISKE